jgi:hypothetical protein
MVNDTALSSVSSFESFLQDKSEKGFSGESFHKESEKILRIDVNGSVWLKLGAAIAYRGELNFRRVPTIAKGISVKEMAMREITPFAEAIGQGTLYCANQGRNIRLNIWRAKL